MIKRCTCEHEFQDSKYGKYMRVFNECAETANGKRYRCTVCKHEITVSKGKKDEKN